MSISFSSEQNKDGLDSQLIPALKDGLIHPRLLQ